MPPPQEDIGLMRQQPDQRPRFLATKYASIFLITIAKAIRSPAVITRFLRMMARTAHGSRAPQMRQKLLFQRAPRLNVEAAIDSLV